MAGFLDKAKAVAQQALDEAKKGVETGQAKLDDVQAKREASKVLAALGAAFYAEQRSNGPRSDVDAALAAVDSFVETNGTAGFPTDEETAAPPPPPPAPTPPPTPPTPPAPPAGEGAGGSAYDLPPSS
ncbi:MAG: hypothetical protein ABI720_04235 [Actinomycetes bacterium]